MKKASRRIFGIIFSILLLFSLASMAFAAQDGTKVHLKSTIEDEANVTGIELAATVAGSPYTATLDASNPKQGDHWNLNFSTELSDHTKMVVNSIKVTWSDGSSVTIPFTGKESAIGEGTLNVDTDVISKPVSFSIVKALDSTSTGSDANQTFTVHVVFTNTGADLGLIKAPPSASGSNGTYDVTLKVTQTATFTNVPVGTAYVVTEPSVPTNWTNTGIASTNTTLVTMKDAHDTVTVTNKYAATDPGASHSYTIQYAYFTNNHGTISSDGKPVTIATQTATTAPITSNIYNDAPSNATSPSGDEYTKGTASTDITFSGTFSGNNLVFTINYYRNSYNIIYNANDGTASPAAVTASGYVTGGPYNLEPTSQGFSKASDATYNYTFGGWSASAGSTDKITQVNVSTGDVNVYAIWLKSLKDTATLTVTKTVNSEVKAPAATFAIDVTFANDDGGLDKILQNGTPIGASSEDHSYSVTLYLSNSGSAAFTNIPYGTAYSVQEQQGDAMPSGFTWSSGEASDVMLNSGNKTGQVDIINVYNSPYLPDPELSVTKSVSADSVFIGTPVTYTVTVNPTDFNYLTSVRIIDTMFPSASGTPAVKIGNMALTQDTDYAYGDGVITITKFPANVSGPIIITYAVTFDKTGEMKNTATVNATWVGPFAPEKPPVTSAFKSTGLSASFTGKTVLASIGVTVKQNASASATVNVIPYIPPVITTQPPATTSPSPSQGIAGDQDKVSPSPSPSTSPSPSQSPTPKPVPTPSSDVAGASDKLPQTGGVSTGTVLGLAGLALIAVGGVTFLLSRRRGNGSY